MAVRTWSGATDGDWGNSANWKEASVPVNGDDVYFLNNTVSVTTGLDQSLVSLNSFHICQTYTGQIGGVSTPFKIGVTNDFVIGENIDGTGPGISILVLEMSNTATKFDIQSSPTVGSDTENNESSGQSILINSILSASHEIILRGGTLGLLTEPGQTGTIAEVTVYGGTLSAGAGADITTLNIRGGTVNTRGDVTTLNSSGGSLNFYGDALTTANIESGGSLTALSDGTITQLNAKGGRSSLIGKDLTVTDITVSSTGTNSIVIDADLVTLTNNIQLSTLENKFNLNL